MASTPDFLDSKRDEIAARLEELRPTVAEYERLEAAVAALNSAVAPMNGTTSSPAAVAQQAAKVIEASLRNSQAMAGRKRGRPKGSGGRQAQALEMVRQIPGVTIPEMAERMGMRNNYLYRVLGGLEKDGLVVKDGKGWHPKG